METTDMKVNFTFDENENQYLPSETGEYEIELTQKQFKELIKAQEVWADWQELLHDNKKESETI